MARLVSGTRVSLFLPANDTAEAAAVTQIVSDLRARFSGCTHSVLQQPVFRGYWFDSDSDTLYVDQVSLVVSDVTLTPDDPALHESLSNLKTDSQAAYAAFGPEQVEVWLIIYSIQRVLQ